MPVAIVKLKNRFKSKKPGGYVHRRIISLMGYYKVFLMKWTFHGQSSFTAVKQLKVLGIIVSATLL